MAVQSLGLRAAGDRLPGWTLANYARFFERSYFHRALLNSLEVTALVTVLSILLAYPLAWVLAYRVPVRWQRAALLSPSCRSGPPTSCAPTAGCWCWPLRA